MTSSGISETGRKRMRRTFWDTGKPFEGEGALGELKCVDKALIGYAVYAVRAREPVSRRWLERRDLSTPLNDQVDDLVVA